MWPMPRTLSESSSGQKTVTMYFGCGCFWHVQHELIKAEQRLLGRDKGNLTAVVGYAGGGVEDGKVCYLDYGEYGHTEVVEILDIPMDKVPGIAEAYWKLFVNGDRVDVQDTGPEYRVALGFPGGMQNGDPDVIKALEEAQIRLPNHKRQELRQGKGSDADTLGFRHVWVYDNVKEHPFYQGEMYHQFHDDMLEIYPNEYKALVEDLKESGRLQPTGCIEPPQGIWMLILILSSIFGGMGCMVCWAVACTLAWRRMTGRGGPNAGGAVTPGHYAGGGGTALAKQVEGG